MEVRALPMGTITKAIEMLNYFSHRRPEIGLSEFVRLIGRDKATVHRHLSELERNGFLEQHPITRAYRLGPAILRLSGVRETTHPLRSVVRPIVTELAQEVGELVHFSLLQGQTLSPVFHADPKMHGTQVHFDEAELLPLHATASGLALLAFAPKKLTDRVLAGPLERFTESTITDPDILRDLMEKVRETGCSKLEQGFDNEVSSHGAPIFGPDGELLGALSIAVPHVRMNPEKSAAIREALKRGVMKITRSIGGNIPPRHAGKWGTDA